MLFNLFVKGEVMVAGRKGNQKIWDISGRFLPRWVSKKELSDDEIEYGATQRSREIAEAMENSPSFLGQEKSSIRSRFQNSGGVLFTEI
jgi:uncharacterized protein YcaQ